MRRGYSPLCGALGGVVGIAAGLMSILALCLLAVLSVVFPPFALLLGLGCWWAWRDYKRGVARMESERLRQLPPPPMMVGTSWIDTWYQPVPTCAPPKHDPRPDSLSD